jgi:hypothetical protein
MSSSPPWILVKTTKIIYLVVKTGLAYFAENDKPMNQSICLSLTKFTIAMCKKWMCRTLIVAFFALPLSTFAQDAPFPGDELECDGPPFAPICPIDGGVSFLIAAGIALGGKKAYDLSRKNA